MKKNIILLFCLGISVYIFPGIPFETAESFPDTLIEPKKENPDEDVKPDTLLPEQLAIPTDSTVEQDTSEEVTGKEVTYAEAELSPTAGNTGKGRITFTKIDNGIKITGEISGLSPGLHGIHIHEFGDCSDPSAESAGGHYNPDQMPHSSPDDVNRHTGDLGNLEADDNGNAIIDISDTKISFEGVNSILGKSLIIHAGRDDLRSQPAGDSGKRILCGIIEQAEKED